MNLSVVNLCNNRYFQLKLGIQNCSYSKKNITKKLLLGILIIILFTNQLLAIDLTQITYIAPKGRVQDKEENPKIDVVDYIITKGKDTLPELIQLLDDDTILEHCHVDYWRYVRIRDVALIILIDLFTDSKGNSTLPELSWSQMFASYKNMTSEEKVWAYEETHGKGSIKKLWNKMWQEREGEIFWDPLENCFRLDANAEERSKNPTDEE
jgi:hypothetical protein